MSLRKLQSGASCFLAIGSGQLAVCIAMVYFVLGPASQGGPGESSGWPCFVEYWGFVTKPYKFIGFGAMEVTKPYKFKGCGAMEACSGRDRLGRNPHAGGGPRKILKIKLKPY